jgi:WD40 repeat protein
MLRAKRTTAALLLLLATGVGVGALDPRAPGQAAAESDEKQPRPVDLHGDPLPDGSLARLGTIRMRHGSGVTGAAFSRDGKLILSSDHESGVHVWDVADGNEVQRFFPKDRDCHRLAMSPDGRTLAVALGDLKVHLCDPRSGREFGTLPKENDTFSILVFSPDSSLLATGTGSKSVFIWDVATRELIHEVTFAGNIGKVAFSSDGKLLACATWDGHCRLWDISQVNEVGRLQHGVQDINHTLYAIFAPDGGPLAVWGYEDRSIRLFDANTLKELRRFTVEDAKESKSPSPYGWAPSIHSSFSPNGKILAVFREAGRIELWDVKSGKKLRTLACDPNHRPKFLEFSPDGTKLLSGGGDVFRGDHAVRLWDVTKGKELLQRAGHGASIGWVAFSPDGKTIASAGEDGMGHLWERSTGTHLLELEGYRNRRPQVAFSSDGRRLIWWGTYDADGTLRIWDARTGKSVSRLELQGPDSFWRTVSDDGETAVSIDLKARCSRFHDLTTGKVIREIPDGAYHQPLVLSPAGDVVVSLDGHLRRSADNKERFEIGRIGSPNLSVKFSADGRRLAAAVTERSPYGDLLSDPPADEIAIVDPIERRELRRFGRSREHYHPIDAATLSSDGKMVVTSSFDLNTRNQQVITLWETETGKARGHFAGHRGQTRCVSISADARFIASGGDDTTALVWDATRPRTRNAFVRPESTAIDVAAEFKNLADDEAERAYASIWALINAPKKTLSFLAEQSSLFAAADVRAIQRWIRDLDSDEFAERERASEELRWILDEAEAHLKKALQSKPSLEAECRIKLLFEDRRTGPVGKELQRYRVIEILEHIAAEGGAPDRLAAVAVLKKLAAGAGEVRPTKEAKASLERLEGPIEAKR